MIALQSKRPADNVRDSAAAQEAENLVRRYQATGDLSCRDAVIKQYWGCLVARANSHPARVHVPVEELISYGVDGMFAAIRLWKPESGVSFGHYLKQKIYFAVQDGLRSMCQSTRTQRERGEVKSFSRLSSVGTEGAREHTDFAEIERAEEADDALRRAPLTWLERVIARLTWREGWSSEEIAEPLGLPDAEVKRTQRALLARLGDGTDEFASRTAAKDANLRRRSKVALAAAERELVAVLRDVDAMLAGGRETTAVRLLLAAHHRTTSRSFDWAPLMLERIAAAAKARGVELVPGPFMEAMQTGAKEPYLPAFGRDYFTSAVEAHSRWMLDQCLLIVDCLLADGEPECAVRQLVTFADLHAKGYGRAAEAIRRNVVTEGRRRGVRLWLSGNKVKPLGDGTGGSLAAATASVGKR